MLTDENEQAITPRRVVIVSDCADVAFIEMRNAILASYVDLKGDGTLPTIEPLVACDRYSLANASFLTRLVAETSQRDIVVMAIMNSLQQRTERIVGRSDRKSIVFEGTNTGVFGWLVEDLGCAECFQLDDPGFVPFGGKYVHAPAVGKILAGQPLSSLGRPFDPGLIRRYSPHHLEVVHIDNFGNMKLNVRELSVREGDFVHILFPSGAIVNAVCWTRMMERSTGEWVLYPGSSLDLYELGQVRSDGAKSLTVSTGDVLSIERIDKGNDTGDKYCNAIRN